MVILITGGAGYIGSVAVKELLNKGNEVIVIDNLSKGKKELVDERAKFYQLDLVDKEKLSQVFEENKIDSIIHFASYKAVEESMKNAVKYSDNITGSINLLNCMVKYKVEKIIFSSTAAVYGDVTQEKISEETLTNPVNFYGYTKLQIENLIIWYNQIYKIKYINLRYFNVAGDAGLDYLDPHAQNVIPIIMEVITGKRKVFIVYGDDYNTSDGTCIRDYIDIRDLVNAHVLALNSKYIGNINLGTSQGVSVKELVKYTEEITTKKLPVEIKGRRPGDPPVVLASNDKAKKILNWVPKHTIKEMLSTTLEAYKNS